MGAQPQRLAETFTPDCPPPFGEWDAVYALRCFGTCCEPEIPDGSSLIIDQQAKIQAGDFVAIWSLTSSGTIKAIIKRLVFDLAPWSTFPYRPRPGDNVVPLLLVEALNPPRRFSIDVERVYAVHRCIGAAASRPKVEIGTDVDYADIKWFDRPTRAARTRKSHAVAGGTRG